MENKTFISFQSNKLFEVPNMVPPVNLQKKHDPNYR